MWRFIYDSIAQKTFMGNVDIIQMNKTMIDNNCLDCFKNLLHIYSKFDVDDVLRSKDKPQFISLMKNNSKANDVFLTLELVGNKTRANSMEILRDLGFEWDVRLPTYLVNLDYSHELQIAISQGCPYDKTNLIEHAKIKRSFECIKIIENYSQNNSTI